MEIVKVPIELIDIEDAPQSKTQQVSLLEMSQIDPVYLTKKDGRYKIVDGRRRVVDLRAAGATEVLALVEDGLADTDVAWRSLVLNAGSHNEMDEADHIIELLSAGYNQSTIAKAINYSSATVSQRIRLAERLSPVLQGKLRRGEMKYSAAQIATKMPKDLQEKIEDLSPKGVSKTLREYQSAALSLFDVQMPERNIDLMSAFSITLNMRQEAELWDGKEIEVCYGPGTFRIRQVGRRIA